MATPVAARTRALAERVAPGWRMGSAGDRRMWMPRNYREALARTEALLGAA